MYNLSHHLYSQQHFDIKWIEILEKILSETGFSNIWQTQTIKSIEWQPKYKSKIVRPVFTELEFVSIEMLLRIQMV
jgi:hypothetical protein